MAREILPGDYLDGRYRIVRRIGEGGMGVVYEAEHILLKRPCAIKILHPSEVADEAMLARFKAEARSAANVRHPNIVEVLDFGLTHDNRPFFVMEYLTGESLADRLNREKRLAERSTVEIADQILSALSAAHRAGIVHRDLKPENIYLTRTDDKREIAKILDFGIVKIVGGSPSRPPLPIATHENPRLTQAGIVLGTPGYMAPETLFGSADVDARADLFSVGVLLFEMLTGERPFHGTNAHEIMVATSENHAPRLCALRPELNPAMEQLILTALTKDPAERFQSAQEFLVHLSAAAVGHLPDQMPPRKSTAQTASQPLPIHQPLPSQGLAPRLATMEHRSQPEPLPPAMLKRRKRRRRMMLNFSPLYAVLLLGLGGAFYYFFVDEDPLVIASQRDPIDERIAALRDKAHHAPAPLLSAQIAPDKKRDDGTPLPEIVTIWLDATPQDITVYWDGALHPERPLIIPGNALPEEVRFTAKGYEEQKMMLTPNQEQTIRVHLKKSNKPR